MNIEQLIGQIATRAGISEDQAKRVVNLLMERKEDVIKLLGSGAAESLKGKLPGGLGKLF
jgi:nucleoid DNA-binding protein